MLRTGRRRSVPASSIPAMLTISQKPRFLNRFRAFRMSRFLHQRQRLQTGRIDPFAKRSESSRSLREGDGWNRRLGDRHQLHPDGARLRLSHCRDGLVHTTHPGLATVEHDGGLRSASMLSRKPLQNTAARKSSTPIRAASSPVPNSPAC
jgi:hypothetical protein